MVGVISAMAWVALAGAAAESPDGERSCGQRIEAGSPEGGIRFDRRRDLRIGAVVFFGLRRPKSQMVETPGRDIALKSAIAVRAGRRPVLLRIPRRVRGSIALSYAAEPDGTTADVRRVREGQSLVRVHPCPPGTPRFSGGGSVGRYTAFSGGFVLRRRGCYPIEVGREGGAFVKRRVAFGRSCS